MSRLTKRFLPFYWQSTPVLAFTQGQAQTVNLRNAGLFDPQKRVKTILVASGTLPSGCSVSGYSIVYDGVGAAASTSFTLTASDGTTTATSTGGSVTIQATQTNQPPAWTVPENYQLPGFTTAGGTLDLTQYADDPEGDPMVFARTGGTAPGGVTVSESGILTVPAGLTESTYTVSVDLTDATAVALPTLAVSSASGAWTFGQAFKQGDVPQYLAVSSGQADIRNRWSDGSVKFAVISAVNQSSVTFSRTATAPSSSEVALSSSPASVTFTGGVTGTYACPTSDTVGTWAKATAHLVRKIAGPVMTERHYYVPTTDAHVAVWFHVRSYSNGATWVETIIENGWARVASPAERAYGVTVTVGGTSRYSASLVHYHHTRWSRRDWIGTDPQILPVHDGAYLKATTLVPNYAPQGISDATLAALPQSVTPFSRGSFSVASDSGGEAPYLALLPLWDAAYVQSGDARAYRAMLVNEQASNCCSMDGFAGACTRDEQSGLPIVLTAFYEDSYNNGYSPNYGAGKVYLGTNTTVNGASSAKYVWKSDVSHSWSGGYLSYLVTGRWFALETCQLLMGNWFLTGGIGSGTNDGMRWGQDRGIAWEIRNLCTALAITPDAQSTLKAGYAAHLQTFWAKWRANEVGFNNLGVRRNIYNYVDYAPSPYLSCGAFQQYFIMQAFGFGYELAAELVPAATRTAWTESLQFHGLFTTGLLGTRPGGYCYRRAGTYGLAVGPNRTTDRYAFFSSWSQVYDAEVAIGKIPAGESCSSGSTLLYGSDDPYDISGTSYFGNMTPAAAYAKQFGVVGADAAWGRFTGSASWASFYANWAESPEYGVLPR